MDIEPNLRIFITGKTQSGKSYLTKKLLTQYENRVVYDIKREYNQFGLIVHEVSEMEEAFNKGCNKVVYQPNDLTTEHFNEFCGWIWRNLRNIVLVVDEVHNFSTCSFIPMEFKRIITVGQGEPYHIGVIAITQRPANTHNDIKSNASLYIAFRLNLDADAKAVQDHTGIPAEQLKELPYKHFFIYNDRSESDAITRHTPL